MHKAFTTLVVAGALASAMTTTVASAAPADTPVVKADTFPGAGNASEQGKENGNGNGWGIGEQPPASPN